MNEYFHSGLKSKKQKEEICIYDQKEGIPINRMSMFQMYIFRMNVYSGHNLLHQIQEKEFIDSPEFESGVNGDEKYQVTN